MGSRQEMTQDNLLQLFEQSCLRYGDKTAFTCRSQMLSYRELEVATRNLAAYLQQVTDLQPGDRVAVQLPNLIEYPVAGWGILRAGMVVVNTNPRYTARELIHQFCDSGVKAIVVLAELLPLVEPLIGQTSIEHVIVVGPAKNFSTCAVSSLVTMEQAIAEGANLKLSDVHKLPDDCALLQYTGGTTGQPKAAILSHQNLKSSASLLWETLDFLEPGEEIFVAPLPLYHVYAFVGHMVIGITYGVHNVLIPEPWDIPKFVEELKAVPFTLFIGLNTLFVSLCQSDLFCELDFSHLKFTLSGGMPLTHSVANRWHQVTGCKVYEGYGLTESSAGVIINTPESYHLGSIGKPMKGIEVKVIDDDGNELEAGQAGELCLRGKPIMLGYWNQPQATEEVLSAEGWLCTGDIAVIREDGVISLVDRKKDLVLVSGFNVYPSEIESLVDKMPQVMECCAVGVPNEKTGEAVTLFIVTGDANLELQLVEQLCKENLAAYKVPSEIKILDALPKSPVGKILRRELVNIARV